jgi:small basic protein (TIGR04137 family)
LRGRIPTSGTAIVKGAASPNLTIGNQLKSVLNTPLAFDAKAVGLHQDLLMSQHRSLRAVATMGGKRNVLKRFERVGLLKKRGQWKDGDRITGLRKTKPDA